MVKKNRAGSPNKSADPVADLSPDSNAVISRISAGSRGHRTIFRSPIGWLIRNPVVFLDETPWRSVVHVGGVDIVNGQTVYGAPPEGDGWEKFTRYFYPREGAKYARNASIYAEALYEQVNLCALKEQGWRDRQDAARRAEREGRK